MATFAGSANNSARPSNGRRQQPSSIGYEMRTALKPARTGQMSDRVTLYPFARKDDLGNVTPVVTTDKRIECFALGSDFVFCVPEAQFNTLRPQIDQRGMTYVRAQIVGKAVETAVIDSHAMLIKWVDVTTIIDLSPKPVEPPVTIAPAATAPETVNAAPAVAAAAKPTL